MNIFDEILKLGKDVLAFFQVDSDVIRFFVYGGTGAIVAGIAEDKQKTFRRFLALAAVGSIVAAFVTPAIIEYYGITNIKYQAALGFILGIGSMYLVGKILRYFKVIKIKMPFKIDAEEGEEDA